MIKKSNKQEQIKMPQIVQDVPEGYYSGDQPNQNLKNFVEQHLKDNPYDSGSDDYNIPAFDKPIQTTKATAIYNMHTYWSKKPHDAIRQYIRHYTQPGDLVLDPFCGSGGTALAALIEGRKAIAIDRSPAATFITKNYCTPVDVNKLQGAFEELKYKIKPEIDWLYETRCDRCGGRATIAYTVYSQIFQCPRCLEKVPLFDCIIMEGETAKGCTKKMSVCPRCYTERGVIEEISTRSERFGSIPVMVSYICGAGCKPARDRRSYNDQDKTKRRYFKLHDLKRLGEIEQKKIPYWFPIDRMMHVSYDQERWGVKWRAGTSNFRSVDELFTKQNLWALSIIRHFAKQSNNSDALMFCLTGIVLSMSKMYLWGPRDEHGIIKGTYYMPQLSRAQNVFSAYCSKFNDFIKAQGTIRKVKAPIFLSSQTCTSLFQIPGSSIDYIFTDPPYAEKVQYGELNFVWEAWLGFDTRWHNEEIIVNDVRGKTEQDWVNMMQKAMSECFRVLKPGRWLSLCYHDTSEGTWALVQDIMAGVGFVVENGRKVLYIDTDQKSFNQLLADKVNKRDLVINFRKPKLGEVAEVIIISGNDNESTFNDKVRIIIREYLAVNPGASKDRIYDEVVSRMVRCGRMEAHNFEELLKTVGVEVVTPVKKNLFEDEQPNILGTHEISRWYLRETELAITDTAESAKEDSVANTLKVFMITYLNLNPEQGGVHYSELFEHYIYAVLDKPRRQLAEILPDYFYKTEDGIWRLPQSKEEEQAKARGRAKGIGRRVKRYIAWLEQGVAIPEAEQPNDATLSEWIRHCKRAGLYGEGKFLYEKGGLNTGNLSEEDTAGVEEDYQVCVRMVERGKQ